jgi:site-specific recombinase XerD
MFDQLFARPSVVARHASAPYAEERGRYLAYCAQRGDSHTTVLLKARELLWVARKLSVYPDLRVTIEQVRAVAGGWQERERACGQTLTPRWAARRFIDVAGAWLRHLGYLRRPVEPIPFECELDEYCHWARHERGLSQATIELRHRTVSQFLRWYGARGQPLSAIEVTHIDTYLVRGSDRGWCRVTVHNVAGSLRAFCRYGADRGWVRRSLASAIQGPRLYALEQLPAGPPWADVQRLIASAGGTRPTDLRDRAILLLMAMYGLRASEVAQLRLDGLDWDHDLLHVSRVKGRTAQAYPLLPTVGNAIIRYLEHVRRPSPRREVFLTLLSPPRPLSRGALYSIVARRLKALGVRTAHCGPHALRHACAARLVAAGLSLKEIGDHLGHRSPAATRIYAKVDLAGLREVAAFDLGGVL